MTRPKDVNSPSRWNMRIWDIKNNQWLCDGEDDVLPYYGFDIRGGEVTSMQSMDWVYRQFEHGRELIWEQSTGLRDKNGKEIYEGDIVDKAYHNLSTYDEKGVVMIGELHDSDGWSNDSILGWCAGSSSLLDVCKDCTVIGNIHENPELLEVKNEQQD